MNSAANSTPAAMPSHSVPSRLSIGMPRKRHQPAISSVATAERMAACVSGGTSWMASLVETWLKPQDRHSTTTMAAAIASSGRVTLSDADDDTMQYAVT